MTPARSLLKREPCQFAQRPGPERAGVGEGGLKADLCLLVVLSRTGRGRRATCFELLPGRTRFRFGCLSRCQSHNVDCRPSASLMWPIRGPGGRHVSTTAAHCVSRFDSFGLRALLRRRLELLPFRGLHLTGAGLLRWRELLFGTAWLLRPAVLPTGAALLLGTALLPTWPTPLLATASGVPILSTPWGLGRP